MTDDTKIIPFIYDENPIRVVKDEQGEPWFVAKDVCAVLEIVNVSKSVDGLDDDEKGLRKVYTPGGQQEMITINESGLYTLVVRSNKPQAKSFRRWVTHDVLPTLRKTGAYAMPGHSEMDSTTMSTLVSLIANVAKLIQKQERIASLLEEQSTKNEKVIDARFIYDLDTSATADFFEFRKTQLDKLTPDVRRFLISRTVIDKEGATILSWLYAMYEQWCFAECSIPSGRNTFYSDVRLAVSGYGEIKTGKRSQLYVTGIRLRGDKD